MSFSLVRVFAMTVTSENHPLSREENSVVQTKDLCFVML
jgi:hypothetical protein